MSQLTGHSIAVLSSYNTDVRSPMFGAIPGNMIPFLLDKFIGAGLISLTDKGIDFVNRELETTKPYERLSK